MIASIAAACSSAAGIAEEHGVAAGRERVHCGLGERMRGADRLHAEVVAEDDALVAEFPFRRRSTIAARA